MNKNIGKYTFRLFDRPKFTNGLTAIVDFQSLMQKYHTDTTEVLADQHAIKGDWQAIGLDIKAAIQGYGR